MAGRFSIVFEMALIHSTLIEQLGSIVFLGRLR